MFGGFLFRAPAIDAIQIADVSIVTSEEFSAMTASVPALSPEVAIAPEIKQPAPTAPVTEVAPEITQPVAQVAPADKPDEQVAILEPEATPAPAPRIDTQSAPKPDPDAKESETTEVEAAPDEKATETAEPTQEQAPKQSADKIVTEADKPDVSEPRPQSRPRDLVEPVAKANEPKPAEDPVDEVQVDEVQVDEMADEIAKALAQAEAEAEAANSKPAAVTGPLMTASEREGLQIALEKCWNVPIGLQNADELIVMLAVDLNPDGSLASMPRLIDPVGPPTGTIKQAFEAGRRALIGCAPYDLPKQKYAQWRELEVVFNPENMVVK